MGDDELGHITISGQEVYNELNNLDKEKSSGPDNLSPTLMQACAAELAEPLCVLFNKSLAQKKLAKSRKQARITPIFKKGKRSDPGNYRPVSLTSQAYKIMERILKKHLLQHLEDRNLISDRQHAFVHHRSCQANLLETMEDWTKMMDEGQDFDIIYLDFKKAFDSVPHKRLITKLYSYEVRGKVLAWVRLLDRSVSTSFGAGSYSVLSMGKGGYFPVLHTFLPTFSHHSHTKCCQNYPQQLQ